MGQGPGGEAVTPVWDFLLAVAWAVLQTGAGVLVGLCALGAYFFTWHVCTAVMEWALGRTPSVWPFEELSRLEDATEALLKEHDDLLTRHAEVLSGIVNAMPIETEPDLPPGTLVCPFCYHAAPRVEDIVHGDGCLYVAACEALSRKGCAT